ncbi:prepilin-type N-terminal cleavage/methylation domain-containing protein [Acholeplasma equifetale]|uniref:prepilin-type N-terminal cleavage/methylation domain-containing protein n=1 Tax=Acholeplasma equifetale TaxID=264634 RepID=UPI0004793BA9|nr:prepilin-type N-terminal cleavage/methylation domain-containing protein [Acholeplasma equifetale]
MYKQITDETPLTVIGKRKKAVTLVELIVVIAIIAILSTVAVVGYTSVVDHANLSADRQEVAQLNRALTVKKSQLNFNAPQTMQEVRDLLDELIEGDFRTHPRSVNQGYHYWFDVHTLQVFLSKSPQDLPINTADPISLPNTIRYEVNWDYLPEAVGFNTDREYLILDTAGSEIGDLIQAFYQVDTLESYQQLHTRSQSFSDLNFRDNLLRILNETVFITDNGNFAESSHPQHAIFQPNIQMITNVKISVNNQQSMIHQENVLLDLKQDYIMIPQTVQTILPQSLVFSGGSFILNRTSFDNFSDGLNPFFTLLDEEQSFLLVTGNVIQTYLINEGGNLFNIETEEVTVLIESVDFLIESFEVSFEAGVSNDYYYAALDTFDLSESNHLKLFIRNIKNQIGTEFVLSSDFHFVSSDTSVAIIDEAGYITVVGAGLVKFTIEADKKTEHADNQTVTLLIGEIESFSLVYDHASVINPLGQTTIYKELSDNIEENVFIIELSTLSFSVDGLTYQYTLSATDIEQLVEFEYIDHETILVKLTQIGQTTIHIFIQEYPNVTVGFNLIVDEPFEDLIEFTFKYKDQFMYKIGNANSINLSDIYTEIDDRITHVGGPKTAGVYDPFPVILNEFDDVILPQAPNGSLSYQINNSEHKFSGTGIIKVVIYVYYQRINGIEDVKTYTIPLEVINGYNVTTLQQLKANTSSNRILINDITLTQYENISVINGATLYGNGFTLDAYDVPARGGSQALLRINRATLDNVKIISRHFPTQEWSTGLYSNSAVRVEGESAILNTYIEGSKSPLLVTGADVVVENTTLVGGSYSNIFVETVSNVVLRNVTTVQNVFYGRSNDGLSDKDVLGVGIVVGNSESTIIIEGDLRQYNWVTTNMISNYAPSDYINTITNILNNAGTQKYKHVIQGQTYINMGIIFLEQTPIAQIQDNRSTDLKQSVQYSLAHVSVTHPSFPLISRTGTIMSFDNTGVIKDDLVLTDRFNAPEYTPNKTTVTKPELKMISSSMQSYYTAQTQTFEFSLEPADIMEFNLLETFIVEKWGYEFPINTDSVISIFTYENAGTHVISFSAVDRFFYDASGNFMHHEITYNFEITIIITRANIPNAEIEIINNTIPGVKISQSGGSHHVALDVWLNLRIYDYIDGQRVLVHDGSDPSKNKNNPIDYQITVTVLGWSSAPPTTFTSKYEHEGRFWLRSDKDTRGEPTLRIIISYVGINQQTVTSQEIRVSVGDLGTIGSGGK